DPTLMGPTDSQLVAVVDLNGTQYPNFHGHVLPFKDTIRISRSIFDRNRNPWSAGHPGTPADVHGRHGAP
ncbi:MAG: hypothetical protein ACR2N2_06170, partial [Acidimicrobiia bacterium]